MGRGFRSYNQNPTGTIFLKKTNLMAGIQYKALKHTLIVNEDDLIKDNQFRVWCQIYLNKESMNHEVEVNSLYVSLDVLNENQKIYIEDDDQGDYTIQRNLQEMIQNLYSSRKTITILGKSVVQIKDSAITACKKE